MPFDFPECEEQAESLLERSMLVLFETQETFAPSVFGLIDEEGLQPGDAVDCDDPALCRAYDAEIVYGRQLMLVESLLESALCKWPVSKTPPGTARWLDLLGKELKSPWSMTRRSRYHPSSEKRLTTLSTSLLSTALWKAVAQALAACSSGVQYGPTNRFAVRWDSSLKPAEVASA